MNRSFAFASTVVVAVSLVACGKKGPPLAPLRIAPAAVTDLSARRVGARVMVRFALPDRNENSSTPVDLARVDVYALSVAKAGDAPPPPMFIREGERIGSVEAKPEQRIAEVSEVLDATDQALYVPESVADAAPSPAAAAAKSPAPAAGVAAPPVRVYLVVPVSRRNHRGATSSVTVPLSDAPPAPAAPAVSYTEKAIVVDWEAEEGRAYNVYEAGVQEPAASDAAERPLPPAPLNPAPLAGARFEEARVEFGKPRCYRLTAVVQAGGARVESLPSPAACVTPADTFAPPPPVRLSAVGGAGTISLIWDAVAAGAEDLAGYVVLRGTSPDDKLLALTPEPIKETTYTDAAVQPGVRYVYAIVAVDKAGNRSPESSRVEEAAR